MSTLIKNKHNLSWIVTVVTVTGFVMAQNNRAHEYIIFKKHNFAIIFMTSHLTSNTIMHPQPNDLAM